MPGVVIEHGFDLLGWLCSVVSSFEAGEQETMYRIFSSGKSGREKYYTKIEREFPFLSRSSGELIKSFDMFSENQIDTIVQKVLVWKMQKNDRIFILAVLSYLERYIHFQESVKKFLLSRKQVADGVVAFSALNNNNEKELGASLIPNFSPLWGNHKRTTSALAQNPLSFVQNYIWVPHREPWNICNLYSENWTHEKGNPFKIVCSPLTNSATFTHKTVDREQYKEFEITGYLQERTEQVQEVIRRTIDYANDIGASIVLFPEMLASPDNQLETQHYIDDNDAIVDPAITVVPSSEHRNEGGDWVNETKVVSSLGEVIMVYHKQHSFQLEDPEEENAPKTGEDEEIDPAPDPISFEPIKADHALYVLHMEGVGRIAIIICADIFEPKLLNILLDDYRINLLLALAYTPGYRRFFDRIALAQNASCEVVWCNTCAAYKENAKTCPTVSYWAFGHKERRPHCEYSCGKDASNICAGCLYEIQIPTNHKEDGVIISKFL